MSSKRTRPGQAPYWTLPGGGAEDTDPTLEAALERELFEELGAIATIGPGVRFDSHSKDGLLHIQHTFLARLVRLDPAMRYGLEFDEPGRGRYDLDRIPIQSDALDRIDLLPRAASAFIAANAEALIVCTRAL